MEISVIALCISMGAAAQTESLEKHAISMTQSAPALELNSAPEPSKEEEKSPSPPAVTAEPKKALAEPQKIPTEPRKVSQGLLEGSVVKRPIPVFPVMARNMNAYGKVEAPIIISKAGQVVEATAINGRPALWQRGFGRGARMSLQTVDAQRHTHEGGNRLDFHLCPWLSITNIYQSCSLQRSGRAPNARLKS